jgi:class 3 adenylate cyclase
MGVSNHSDGEFPATEAVPLEALFGLQPEPEGAATAIREGGGRAEEEGPIATFLYARISQFGAACQALGGAELTGFVNEVRRVLSASSVKLGGEIAQRRPDSILCVFSHNPEDRIPTHAKRALHAAVLTVQEAMLLAARVRAPLEAAGAQPMSIAIGVHLGPGDVTPRTNTAERMVHATGEAVEIARVLEGVASSLHWGVVASAATRQAAGTRVESGRSGSLALPDETFLEVTEIAGLVARPGSTTPPSHYEAIRESLLRNQQASRAGASGGPTGHLLLEDYRLLRKIGEGGIASVYLAQPIAGGPTQVLKVLPLDGPDGQMGLQRFMQEYALLAGIDHPNVARFHRQGFSVGSAFIAMEYFPLGDLRARMRRPLDAAVAVYYLRQIASGLDAIHRSGIVHRDLKPDNVMVRQNGIVALTDFGVAKQVSMQITDTGDGEVVGTPYYLSPEQALGRPVDCRADLYSLGVLLFEMLTGSKPYYGKTAEELLRLHVEAPVPTLPPRHQRFQPLVDRLMAKAPEHRYATAAEVLADLEQLQ